MSFNPYDAPLSLNVKPSLQKWLIIFIPHVFVILLIFSFKEFNPILKVVLVVGVIVSLSYYYRLHLSQFSIKSVTQVQHTLVKTWLVSTTKNRDLIKFELLPSSFVSNYLIILNFNVNNTAGFIPSHTVLFTKDSLSKDEFRILKVRLKTAKLS